MALRSGLLEPADRIGLVLARLGVQRIGGADEVLGLGVAVLGGQAQVVGRLLVVARDRVAGQIAEPAPIVILGAGAGPGQARRIIGAKQVAKIGIGLVELDLDRLGVGLDLGSSRDRERAHE